MIFLSRRLETSDPRFSGVTIHNGTVYIAGQVGDVSKIDSSDVSQQTSECLEKIDQLLTLAGSSKSRILEARIWLKNINDDMAEMNKVWNQWVDPQNKGVRYCVESALAKPQFLVEVQVIAAL
ncbi:uncharacterized protein LOC111709095 [Eurytemora carolleeae]|uniref:uncharacterized protein LOC111709095 n=1 Tax=Eurytemora carolleeae TaxID=1294199 RepID=UPI000C7827EF|nr:uncharacterized protein LOC111709095 [Eurytemora carolleeae]|eukprot:XP_023338462.1 uncharacterized protein LOC111709095 [Eurytemora affinis]